MMRWRAVVAFGAVFVLAACGGEPLAEPTPAPAPPAAAPASTAELRPVRRVEISEDLYVREIQEGAFVATHVYPWAANSLVVEMENGALVLVDTPYTPEATRELLAWLETQLGEREVVAVNTGFHYDNLGGNGYLLERGIPVHGSSLTARLLEQRGEEMRAMTLDWLADPRYERYREAQESLVYVPPDHRFELAEGLELRFGEETVQVYYPGPSHSPDNVVVYFPGRRILFGGCMIIGGDSMGNTSDADLKAWPGSVRRLVRFDYDVLVPGHGDRLDPGLLDHTIRLLVEAGK